MFHHLPARGFDSLEQVNLFSDDFRLSIYHGHYTSGFFVHEEHLE